MDKIFDIFDSRISLSCGNYIFVASYKHKNDKYFHNYWAGISNDAFTKCRSFNDFLLLQERYELAVEYIFTNFCDVFIHSDLADLNAREGISYCPTRSELNRILECKTVSWAEVFPKYLFDSFFSKFTEKKDCKGEYYAGLYLLSNILIPYSFKNLWNNPNTIIWNMDGKSRFVFEFALKMQAQLGVFPPKPLFFKEPNRTKYFKTYQNFLFYYKEKIDRVLRKYNVLTLRTQADEFFYQCKNYPNADMKQRRYW